MANVVVSGAIANKYRSGGEAWVRLSWVLGLRRLGCSVYFLEQIGRESCVDAQGAVTPFERCVNLAYFEEVVEEFGLADSAALVYEEGEQTSGPSYEELLDIAESADLLVNISGHLSLEPLMRRIECKAYVDLDPGFTQFWHAAGDAGARLGSHDYYFTVGENIGTAACPIPTSGITWRPVRPPVVLEQWPVVTEGDSARFTTIATWRGPFGPIEQEGGTLGLKVHEFRKMIELPQRVPLEFEIALDIHPGDAKDLEALRAHGWRIVDPKATVPDPEAFRRYVQTSGAEFSVAQGIYVETQSGWFSDRTVRYLASGKPALVQETGFNRDQAVKGGLVTFRTLEEAIAGAERIAGDYPSHSEAARAFAEEHFDSDVVLSRFLDEVGVAP
jgi:hypothetical protein